MNRPQITTQLVEHEGSGKYRIMISILKDEFLEVSFIVNADDAASLSLSLAELSRQARGKSIILPGGGLA